MKQPSETERASIMVGASQGPLLRTKARMENINNVIIPKHRAFMLAQEICSHYEITPLDYMLQVINNKDIPRDIRLDAAKAAAPFVHKKQAQHIDIDSNTTAVTVGITPEDVKQLSDDEVDSMLSMFSKMKDITIGTIDVNNFNIIENDNDE
jgi:hypothetical protein